MVMILPPIKTKADVGPKPVIDVTFENMGNELCYGTLLSNSKFSYDYMDTVWNGEEVPYEVGSMDYKVWKAFVEYEDEDDYYFLQEFWLCSETKEIKWISGPPYSFKILLYYPEKDIFVTSGIYQYYEMHSYYTVDMAGIDISSDNEARQLLVLEEMHEETHDVFEFIFRIVLTILIELGLALLFGFRGKKAIVIITTVNLITQIILNLLILKCSDKWGVIFLFYYICFELAVFVIEAVLYSILLPRKRNKMLHVLKCISYSFIANAFSFIGGTILLYAMLQIFI